MGKTVKVDITMYGIAEVLHWCHDRNKGRIAGVDTAGFEKMKALLAEKPQSGDYFTLDQFWKKKVSLELTEEEVALIDRCRGEPQRGRVVADPRRPGQLRVPAAEDRVLLA